MRPVACDSRTLCKNDAFHSDTAGRVACVLRMLRPRRGGTAAVGGRCVAVLTAAAVQG